MNERNSTFKVQSVSRLHFFLIASLRLIEMKRKQEKDEKWKDEKLNKTKHTYIHGCRTPIIGCYEKNCQSKYIMGNKNIRNLQCYSQMYQASKCLNVIEIPTNEKNQAKNDELNEIFRVKIYIIKRITKEISRCSNVKFGTSNGRKETMGK